MREDEGDGSGVWEVFEPSGEVARTEYGGVVEDTPGDERITVSVRFGGSWPIRFLLVLLVGHALVTGQPSVPGFAAVAIVAWASRGRRGSGRGWPPWGRRERSADRADEFR